MERSWLMAALVVGLLTTGFAEEGYADVIYFKPGINPTAMFPPRTDIFPYRRVTRSGTQQLKAVRAEVKDSDADYPHIAEIVSNHWNGGEEEAIRISHEVAQNPVNAKEKKEKK